MKIQGYTCEITKANRGWIARFPRLPGLVAHGTTREMTEVMAQEVVSDYLSGTEDYLDDLSASAGPQSLMSNVIDAVVAILGGQAAGVWRTRFRPFAMAELPADNIIPGEDTPDYQDNSDVEIKFRFQVRHTGQAVDEVDKYVDSVRYVRAYQLIMADPTLGGLVRYTRYMGSKWEFEKGEYDSASQVVTWEVEFSTNRRDPSVAGY